MRIFCDTNVLVAAFISRGLCADLLRGILAHEELLTSDVVLEELVRVLHDKLNAPNAIVRLAVDLLRRQTVVERPENPWPGTIEDPDDAWVLASALESGADVLVTGDRDPLTLEPIPGIQILEPRELWSILAARHDLEREQEAKEMRARYPAAGPADDGRVMEPAFRSCTSHQELDVYILAFRAAGEIYQVSKGFPKEEQYSLTDQIRRSSRSVCANLAEAWRKRRYRAAFQAKLNDAEAEAAETQTWLRFAEACAYLDPTTVNRLSTQYDGIIGKLVTMINNPEPWLIRGRNR